MFIFINKGDSYHGNKVIYCNNNALKLRYIYDLSDIFVDSGNIRYSPIFLEFILEISLTIRISFSIFDQTGLVLHTIQNFSRLSA